MAIGGSENLVLITGKRKYKRQDDLYGSRRNWEAKKTKNEILLKKYTELSDISVWKTNVLRRLQE